jgi:hypothetical protein
MKVSRSLLLVSGWLLLLVGIAKVFVEVGPRGPTLWDFGGHHGIDAGDLLAVPIVLVALLLLWRARWLRATEH